MRRTAASDPRIMGTAKLLAGAGAGATATLALASGGRAGAGLAGGVVVAGLGVGASGMARKGYSRPAARAMGCYPACDRRDHGRNQSAVLAAPEELGKSSSSSDITSSLFMSRRDRGLRCANRSHLSLETLGRWSSWRSASSHICTLSPVGQPRCLQSTSAAAAICLCVGMGFPSWAIGARAGGMGDTLGNALSDVFFILGRCCGTCGEDDLQGAFPAGVAEGVVGL